VTLTRLSPAAINRYRTCPRSFLLTDIQRRTRTEASSPILAQGNAIHHALERFFGLPVEHRNAETIELALRSVWPEHRRRAGFVSPSEEAAHGLAAIAMLRSFTESFDISCVPVAREQWVQARLPTGVEIFGKVDRIDRLPSGRLDVIDYKTGRHQLDADDLRQEPAVHVYVVATEATYSLEVERVRFVYLASATEVSWSPEREDIQAIKRRLLQLTENLAAESKWEARPAPHLCRTCPAALHCDERGRVTLDELVAGKLVF